MFPGVVVSNMFYFHPEYILGEDEPILTCAYFSKGVFLHFDEGHTLFFFPSSQLVSRRLPIHQPSFEFQDLAMLTPCTWSCCTGVSEFIGHGEKEVPKLEKMVWVARHVEKRCIYIYMCVGLVGLIFFVKRIIVDHMFLSLLNVILLVFHFFGRKNRIISLKI